MTVLHLESLENNLFELYFAITKKTWFYDQTLSGGLFSLHGYDIFSRFLLLSMYQNISESIRPCFRKKSEMSQ